MIQICIAKDFWQAIVMIRGCYFQQLLCYRRGTFLRQYHLLKIKHVHILYSIL